LVVVVVVVCCDWCLFALLRNKAFFLKNIYVDIWAKNWTTRRFSIICIKKKKRPIDDETSNIITHKRYGLWTFFFVSPKTKKRISLSLVLRVV